jgi:hypothetical protein
MKGLSLLLSGYLKSQESQKMSRLDPTLLRDLGVLPARGPVELPLYARFRPEVVTFSGRSFTRSVPRDVSSQELSSVLLRLTDFRHFTRYIFNEEKYILVFTLLYLILLL